MRDALPEIHTLGAELVVVGNGRPEHARSFRGARRLAFPLLVDPELRAYKAAGLRRGILASLGPGPLRRGLRAFRSGLRQGATQGDPWQQGGVFVIAPDGRVPFAYVSREAGDHPEIREIVAALRGL